MKYHFKIHKEKNGFWAECVEILWCVTQGDSREELFTNMQEAISTCLEEPEDSTYLAPDDTCIPSRSIVEVSVDPAIAFGFLVWYHRIKSGLSQKEAARRIGVKNVFRYQRLERRCNATLDMVTKIVEVFPEFSLRRVF